MSIQMQSLSQLLEISSITIPIGLKAALILSDIMIKDNPESFLIHPRPSTRTIIKWREVVLTMIMG